MYYIDQCSILGIDPTFHLGEFSVTVTTYRHLQLIERRTRKPPVLLGPMLIHQKKTRESYYFLASGIVGLCPNLRGLVASGTDGEKVIGEAFKIQFGEAKHLLCFIHVKHRLKVNCVIWISVKMLPTVSLLISLVISKAPISFVVLLTASHLTNMMKNSNNLNWCGTAGKCLQEVLTKLNLIIDFCSIMQTI